MTEKEKVYAYLEQLQLSYTKIDHKPMYTIEDIAEDGIDPDGYIAKNLFLRNDNGKQHYLVTICGDKNADLKEVRKQLGSSRLSFASEDRLMKCFGVPKGSVSPLGILNDAEAHVIVAFDEDLLKQPLMGVHPNDNTSTVFLDPAKLAQLIRDRGNQFMLIKI